MPERIVVLDGYTLNPSDLSWDSLRDLGDVTIFDNTKSDQIVERAADAAVVLTNKVCLDAEAIGALPRLRYIGVLATGYDVVDIDAAKQRGIPVSNVPAYGTNSVAQFTFALLLELCHRVQQHSDDVRAGGWIRRNEWSYHLVPMFELAGRTLGLVGFGRIARQTAAIAHAFGMHVIAADPALQESDGVESTSLEDVLGRSDVVSLHCPLTPETRGLLNAQRLRLMKTSAILINTSRGPLIDEQALADALNSGSIGGAALDVLPEEPPTQPGPLMSAKNCIVTPHIAWATREARGRLMQIAVDNVRAYLEGKPVNVVNL